MDKEIYGRMLVAYALVGASIGLSLRLHFTALSPLVIGGMIGFIVPGLATILCAGTLIYKFYKKKLIEEGHKNAVATYGAWTVVSTAIGVGLAAAITAIFPGAMIGAGSTALTGAVIGAIALTTGFLLSDKVNDYIISPIIEHFSSKGKGYEPV
ncbi:MAG: hypothetical protein LBV62_01710 [Rickettsiales bacterium]|jgi:uncharacterized membrane-anchored protein|nr:hypothetical protein [Rickettsiales bacterium]